LLYATTFTAQRLKLPHLQRSIFAGLLAVNVDLSLDAMANYFNFWKWRPAWSGNTYYGVPWDNFVCWFVIVCTFSFLVRYCFEQWGHFRLSWAWIPLVIGIASIVVVTIVDQLLNRVVYPWFRADVGVFNVLLLAAFTLVALKAYRVPRTNLKIDWLVLTVPFAYHSIALGMLLFAEPGPAPQEWLGPGWPPTLRPHVSLHAVVIPLGMLGGLLAFSWSSLGPICQSISTFFSALFASERRAPAE
jgi:hypothetical protein